MSRVANNSQKQASRSGSTFIQVVGSGFLFIQGSTFIQVAGSGFLFIQGIHLHLGNGIGKDLYSSRGSTFTWLMGSGFILIRGIQIRLCYGDQGIHINLGSGIRIHYGRGKLSLQLVCLNYRDNQLKSLLFNYYFFVFCFFWIQLGSGSDPRRKVDKHSYK